MASGGLMNSVVGRSVRCVTSVTGDRAAVSGNCARGSCLQVHSLPRPSVQTSDSLHPRPAHRRLQSDRYLRQVGTRSTQQRRRFRRLDVVNGRSRLDRQLDDEQRRR